MGFDAKALQQLELVYLASRNPKDLVPLYNSLLKAGFILLTSYQRRINLRLSKDRKDEVVHDATTRLLEMYLKFPKQTSIPLASRMYLEIIHNLHDRKTIISDRMHALEISDNLLIKDDYPLEEEDPLTKIKSIDIKIIIDLYRAVYYKRAIIAIARYTSKDVIYKLSKELKFVYDILHYRKKR